MALILSGIKSSGGSEVHYEHQKALTISSNYVVQGTKQPQFAAIFLGGSVDAFATWYYNNGSPIQVSHGGTHDYLVSVSGNDVTFNGTSATSYNYDLVVAY